MTAFEEVVDCLWRGCGLLMDMLRTAYGEVVADCFWRGCGLLLERLMTAFGEVGDRLWGGW